ncbi:LOW QUALITY PROTEIN: damage-control phosphatase ARMT1-like [Haliotis rubra]|uniref:LOW QUALITY PROTEIN: damage-control phosphatase ARMT1-like n=1 Tax=Haliotis rubra TaxID=36100 RepID=UPI001EE5EB68|nr:LOW QUALITY PROTEIN: damage-control phosphatase ARMT1-like [Haliotis rubra]
MDNQESVSDVPDNLSAKYKDSFAYLTIRDRLPVILTKVVDTVYRMKNKMKDESGEETSGELKDITGRLSKLRFQIQTDKPVENLEDSRTDTPIWNQHHQDLLKLNNGQPIKWFSAAWLYLECYMYRRIQESVELTWSSDNADKLKLTYLLEVVGQCQGYSSALLLVPSSCEKADKLKQFLEVALWGNKCDLSISAGFSNSQTTCILDQLKLLNPNILADHSQQVIETLQRQTKGEAGRVDIVLDNAGFELVTDLCLAEFLMSAGLASSIHFHGKAIPWFVSDVTRRDFQWLLETMKGTNNLAISTFGAKWQKLLELGSWVYHDHDFWTTPFDFSLMKKHASELYNDLGKADLVFFKGDLNYRKLVGDKRWEPTVSFSSSLRGFEPAPLCSLRALKSDVVVGLKPGQAEMTQHHDKDWMIDGKWAVISFHTGHS